MPHQKSIRTIIAEILMLVGMVVVVGHMATNFWERFMLQSELTTMKTSLYTLKDAVNNIGNAYDNLYKELQGLALEDKATYKPETDTLTEKESSALIKPSIKHDEEMQSQAVLLAAEQARNLLDIGTTIDKAVEDFMQQCKKQDVTNISMFTSRSCPFSSIELGINHLDTFPEQFSNCIRRCYNCSVSGQLFNPAL